MSMSAAYFFETRHVPNSPIMPSKSHLNTVGTNHQPFVQLKPILTDISDHQEVPVNYWLENLERWQQEVRFWQQEFASLSRLYDSCSHLVASTGFKLEWTYQQLESLMTDTLPDLANDLEKVHDKIDHTHSGRRGSMRRAAYLRKQLEAFQERYKKQKIQFLEALYDVIPLSFF